MPDATERMPLAQAISDDGLRKTVLDLWERSREMHAKQRSPSSPSSNGRKHCLCVEQRMHEVVTACVGVTLSDCERALLSAAACCHDYGRTLSKDGLAEFGDDHGAASAALVGRVPEASGLDPRLRTLLAHVVKLHTPAAAELTTKLVELGPSPGEIEHWGSPRVPMLVVLLRLADMLDTTMDRIDTLPAEGEFGSSGAYHSTVFRWLTWAVHVEPTSVRIDLRYRTADERKALDAAAKYMKDHEFLPLVPLLESNRLPSHLYCEPQQDDLAYGMGTSEPIASAGHACDAAQPGAESQPVTRDAGSLDALPQNLTAACHAMRAARDADLGAPAPQYVSESLAGSRASAYWFASSLSTPQSLVVLETPLSQIARGPDLLVAQAVCDSVCRVAAADGGAVVRTTLPSAFWAGATPWHRRLAVRVLDSARGWGTPLGRTVLREVATNHRELADFVALGLHRYAKEQPERVGDVLDWYLSLMTPSAGSDEAHAGEVALEWSLGRLIARSGRHGLRRAFRIIEADLARRRGARAAMFEVRHSLEGIEDTRPFAKARGLLISELNAPSEEGNEMLARRVVRHLLSDEREHMRYVGMCVCRAAAEVCGDLTAVALRRPEAYLEHARDLALRLVYEGFSVLSQETRGQVEAALLALPLEPGEDRWHGLSRLEALQALPEPLRSEAVQAEISRLLDANPWLTPPAGSAQASPEPPQPGFQIGCLPQMDYGAALDFSDTVDDPDAIVARACDTLAAGLGDAVPEARYAVEDALRRVVTGRRELRVALATRLAGLADAQRGLYELLVPGLVIALGEDGEFTARDALDLAAALPEDPGSRVRDAVAYVIGDSWDTVPEDRRIEAAKVLANWSRQEGSPALEDEAPTAQSLIDTAINTPAGVIAGAMAWAAYHLGADAGEDLLSAIEAQAGAPSPVLRAAVLDALPRLLRDHHPRAVAIAQAALAEGPATLLHLAVGTLRHLGPDEVAAVGLPLLERFIDAEDDETQEAVGFLAAVWALSHEDTSARSLVLGLARYASDAVRRSAARVIGHNVVGGGAGLMCRAQSLCRALLDEGDPVLQVGLLAGFPVRDDVDFTEVADLLRDTARSGSQEVLDKTAELLSVSAGPLNPGWVAPIIEGLLESPGAIGPVFAGLGGFGTKVVGVYDCLASSGHDDLALKLLDAAAYHCVEDARPAIEAIALQGDESHPKAEDGPQPQA